MSFRADANLYRYMIQHAASSSSSGNDNKSQSKISTENQQAPYPAEITNTTKNFDSESGDFARLQTAPPLSLKSELRPNSIKVFESEPPASWSSSSASSSPISSPVVAVSDHHLHRSSSTPSPTSSASTKLISNKYSFISQTSTTSSIEADEDGKPPPLQDKKKSEILLNTGNLGNQSSNLILQTTHSKATLKKQRQQFIGTKSIASQHNHNNHRHRSNAIIVINNNNNHENNNNHNHSSHRISKKSQKKAKTSLSSPVSGKLSSASSSSDASQMANATTKQCSSGGDGGGGGGSWHNFFLPSYRNKLAQFHRTFMDIPGSEKLVDDFLCALHRDILLQGRIYVAINHVAFYSNILGYETSVTLAYRDIRSIAKATTIKLFPNAIEIHTVDGTKYFFTSFVSRERAFQLIKALWIRANSRSADTIASDDESASVDRVALGLPDLSDDNAAGPQPITWPDICKLIRQSYSISGDFNLNDFENVDLADQDMLKGKNIRKRLKIKKERRLLAEEEEYKKNCSELSWSSASSSSPQNERKLREIEHTEATSNSAELRNHHNHENNVGRLEDPNDWNSSARVETSAQPSTAMMMRMMRRLPQWTFHQIGSALDRFGHSVGHTIRRSVVWISDDRRLAQLVIMLTAMLLLMQIVIYVWLDSYDERLQRYQETISRAIAIASASAAGPNDNDAASGASQSSAQSSISETFPPFSVLGT